MYWALEKRIVPGLRSSQYAYYEAVRAQTASRPVWLDVGCGHQVFASWMDKEEAEVTRAAAMVVGMDFDLPSLKKHATIRRVLVGDLSAAPFASGVFDLITANMVVEHIDDPRASLREIRRLLKPGGVFICHTPNFLHFWICAASLVPDFLKKWMVRLQDGRRAEDVFPTRYRMNTPGAIGRFAEEAGLRVSEVKLVSTSAATAILGPLSVFELIALRLLQLRSLRRFRSNLVAVLENPAAAAQRAA
jgi:SAM-dependent methyltransferase